VLRGLVVLISLVTVVAVVAVPSAGAAPQGTLLLIRVVNTNDNVGATGTCGGPPFFGVDATGGNYLLDFQTSGQTLSGSGCFSGTLSVSKNGKRVSTTETFGSPGLYSLTIEAKGKLTYPGIAPNLALATGHWRVVEATGLLAGIKVTGTWTGSLDTTQTNPFPLGPPPHFSFNFVSN
jgi:hypothetical protein